MSGKIDFTRINAHALTSFLTLLTEWIPGGHKEGNEYVAHCPFHSEKSASFKANLNKGVWCCFGCGKGESDPVSLYAALQGKPQGEAAKELSAILGLGGNVAPFKPLGAPKEDAKKKVNQEWLPIVPVPEAVPAPLSFKDYHCGEPENVWTYRGPNNELLGYIRRFRKTTENPDGTFGKEIKPLVWAQKGSSGEYAWRPLAFPKPRPLYGLELLAARPEEGVTIVEGEKAADAGRQIIPGVVVTWPGGGKAVKHVDWSPLKGRRVFVWPDLDRKVWKEGETGATPENIGTEKPQSEQAGYKAAIAILDSLDGIAESAKLIMPPLDMVDGWDAADALADGWDKKRVTAHIKQRLNEMKKAPAPPEPKAPDRPQGEIMAEVTLPPRRPPEDQDAGPSRHDWPFRILGHDKGEFYYLPNLSKQVVTLSARAHTKNEFLTLAPLGWWEEMFPGKDDGAAVNWLAAANSLMQQALPREFDPHSIRGRGCWLDDCGVIYHAGDHLLINGNTEAAIDSVRGRFVYERGRRLHIESIEPATTERAGQFRSLCKTLSLKHKIDAEFLAGWIVLAPICGVLKWRPHIWVTGAAGTGKSTVLNDIVKPMLGKTALIVQGATTEAGIRQKLGMDALPVMFDEADTEEKADAMRIQNVLTLMRAASSDTDGVIAKGTANGDGQSYIMRSAFCLASIGVAASRRADRSRITLIELVKELDKEKAAKKWEDIKSTMADTVWSPGFCEALRARSLQLAPTIVKNAAVFARAATPFLGTQRDGDQVGALLAGAYSLASTKEITFEEAQKYCAAQDWTPWKTEAQDMDEHRAYSLLMESIVNYQAPGDKAYRLSIAELIAFAMHPTSQDRDTARVTLERYGIGVRKNGVDVSVTHSELKRIFQDSPFAGKWGDQLRRINGSAALNCSHFNGVAQRAVRLPRTLFSIQASTLALDDE